MKNTKTFMILIAGMVSAMAINAQSSEKPGNYSSPNTTTTAPTQPTQSPASAHAPAPTSASVHTTAPNATPAVQGSTHNATTVKTTEKPVLNTGNKSVSPTIGKTPATNTTQNPQRHNAMSTAPRPSNPDDGGGSKTK